MILKDWLDKKYTNEQQYNLTYLYCSGIGITSLEGIEQLTNLEELYCHSNKLTSLKGIEQLTKLKWLSCSYNKLTTLKGIENLDKLQYLGYSNNSLPYSVLKDFDKIKLEVKKEIRQYKIKNLLLYL